MVHPRVLRAISTPLLGHLDPAFLALMNDIQVLLRFVFETKNRFTIAVSGTGSAGMEASIVNIVEPGDAVIVGVNGVFGTRWATIVERCGGKAIRVEAPWGQVIDPDAIDHALRRSGPVKAVAIVHAETSTGAYQPLEPIARLCRDRKSTRLNSSHLVISYAVFCLKKKNYQTEHLDQRFVRHLTPDPPTARVPSRSALLQLAALRSS